MMFDHTKYHVYQDQRQEVYRFPNWYGASIINDGYGREEGLLELAVILFDGPDSWDFFPDYDTPITDDVLGYLKPEKIHPILEEIFNLEPPKEPA